MGICQSMPRHGDVVREREVVMAYMDAVPVEQVGGGRGRDCGEWLGEVAGMRRGLRG